MPDAPDGHVVVFARHPEADAPKRRLVPRVGDAGARRLHRAFLRDTLDAARASGARVVLAHTPGPPFEELGLADWSVLQEGASFGERLDRALAAAHAHFGTPQLVLGVDTPHLGPARIRAALAALAEVPAVLGPSPRGGFHLLGLRGAPPPFAEVFEAPGEGPALERLLRARGLGVRVVEPCTDVDLPEDLERLAESLSTAEVPGGWRPRATAEALAACGLLRAPGPPTG